MANDSYDDTPKMSEDLDLGPGLVVTPGHPVEARDPHPAGVHASDRRIDAHGYVDDVPVLSTHPYSVEKGGQSHAALRARVSEAKQGGPDSTGKDADKVESVQGLPAPVSAAEPKPAARGGR